MSTTLRRITPATLRVVPGSAGFLDRDHVDAVGWRVMGRPTSVVLQFYLRKERVWVEISLRKSDVRELVADVQRELARWDRN